MHRSEANPVFLFDRSSICATEGAISRTNCGKRTKRKANQVRQGNTEVVERCLLQVSVIVSNVTAMEVVLTYNSLNFQLRSALVQFDQASKWKRRFLCKREPCNM